ncbi:facilitator of iron transport 1-like [Varanus komodoensis]|uniref:Uncharacterized protein n=1 Tax=Varanus komodoensis TaxID=61221 RepID=A0A8D2JJK6_VARKO|nr:facilitator of iron transport 1-like [Varanus komodoensis]
MAGTCLSLCSLHTVCCFLAGTLLSLPGNGQNVSTVWTIAYTAITVDGDTTVASELNASSSSSPETLASATLSSVNVTTALQITDHFTNASIDMPSLPTPTADFKETNHSRLDDDAKPTNTTFWVISSTDVMATETFQSKEIRGTAAVPQPTSPTFSSLGPTERRSETMPVTDHEITTEESTAKSTAVPSATITDAGELTQNASNITTSTPGVVSSTLMSQTTVPVETEQPTNHIQKTSVADGEDLPSMPETKPISEDPLVIALIFIFIVTIGILALMGFLRYRRQSGQLQFRRLQDLPMDDMMEDTPLSLYSY